MERDRARRRIRETENRDLAHVRRTLPARVLGAAQAQLSTELGPAVPAARLGTRELASALVAPAPVFGGEGGAAVTVRRKGGADRADERLAEVRALLASAPSGAPVPASAREAAERTLGTPLADVRLHTGPQAAEAAARLGARAFTVGRDVFFGAGELAPSTSRGWELLAHELVHAAAAPVARVAPDAPLRLGGATDTAEHLADRGAARMDAALAGSAPIGAPPAEAPGGPVVRCERAGARKSKAPEPAWKAKARDEAASVLKRLPPERRTLADVVDETLRALAPSETETAAGAAPPDAKAVRTAVVAGLKAYFERLAKEAEGLPGLVETVEAKRSPDEQAQALARATKDGEVGRALQEAIRTQGAAPGERAARELAEACWTGPLGLPSAKGGALGEAAGAAQKALTAIAKAAPAATRLQGVTPKTEGLAVGGAEVQRAAAHRRSGAWLDRWILTPAEEAQFASEALGVAKSPTDAKELVLRAELMVIRQSRFGKATFVGRINDQNWAEKRAGQASRLEIPVWRYYELHMKDTTFLGKHVRTIHEDLVKPVKDVEGDALAARPADAEFSANFYGYRFDGGEHGKGRAFDIEWAGQNPEVEDKLHTMADVLGGVSLRDLAVSHSLTEEIAKDLEAARARLMAREDEPDLVPELEELAARQEVAGRHAGTIEKSRAAVRSLESSSKALAAAWEQVKAAAGVPPDWDLGKSTPAERRAVAERLKVPVDRKIGELRTAEERYKTQRDTFSAALKLVSAALKQAKARVKALKAERQKLERQERTRSRAAGRGRAAPPSAAPTRTLEQVRREEAEALSVLGLAQFAYDACDRQVKSARGEIPRLRKELERLTSLEKVLRGDPGALVAPTIAPSEVRSKAQPKGKQLAAHAVSIAQLARHGLSTIPDWVTQAFTKNGWSWGGAWCDKKDAMHFEWPGAVAHLRSGR